MNNDYENFNPILDQARRLISVEFQNRECKKVLPGKIGCILRKKRIEGMANSGPELRAVRDACEEEIDERAKIAWASIKRAHKAFGSHITNTLVEDLKQEVNSHIVKIVKYAFELMAKRLRLTEPTRLNENLAYFERIKSEVEQEYNAEVDIYIASLTQKKAGPGEKTTKKSESRVLREIADNLSIWNKAGPGENGNLQGWANLSPEGQEAAEYSLLLMYDNANLLHECARIYGTEHQDCRTALTFLNNIMSGISERAQITRHRGCGHDIALLGFISELRQWAGMLCQGKIPSDLIDLAKAVGLYHRSRAQIKRDIKDGKIKDYRKIEKGKHWISKSEADSLYISK